MHTLMNFGPFFIPVMLFILIGGIVATKNDPGLSRFLRIAVTLFLVWRGFELGSIFSLGAFIFAGAIWTDKIANLFGAIVMKLIDDPNPRTTNPEDEAVRLSKLVHSGKRNKALALGAKLKKNGHSSVYIDTMLSLLPEKNTNKKLILRKS